MIFTDQNFKQEVEDSQGIVLVDFHAPWCGPCKMMAPAIEELNQEYNKNQNVKIGKLNVDENQATALKYQIMGVPTTIIYKNGEIIEKAVGLRSKDDLKAIIEKNIK